MAYKKKTVKTKAVKKVEKKTNNVEEVKIEEPQEEVKRKVNNDYIAIVDITRQYRKGDIVPGIVVEEWKSRGINVELMVK